MGLPNKQALMLAGVLAAGLGFYVWVNWEAAIPVPGSARAPAPQPVESVPGGEQTAAYTRLEALANDGRATVAYERDGSAVPTPPAVEPQAASEPATPPPAPGVPQTPPPPPLPGPAVPAQPPDPDRLSAELARAMANQAKELVAFREQRFSPRPTHMTTFEDVRGQRERAAAEHRAQDLAPAAGPARPRDRSGLLQPGDILYAVLQTAINSDEPGPVRAKVTGERFQGAILLGSLNRFPPAVGSRPERVLVSFNYLTTPQDRVTYDIEGFAIDLATARTALATGVDHHYLSRWGALIAASFLEGYGNAVRNSNRVTSVGPLGNVITVPKDDIDDEAIAREAVGTVGERLADAVGQNFQRPNTITVEAGTGIGVLIVTPSDEDNAARAHNEPAEAPPRSSRRARVNRSTTFPDGAPTAPVFTAPSATE